MIELLELAARIEAASGADRALDQIIMAAAFPENNARVIEYDGGLFCVEGGEGDDWHMMRQSKHFTGSLDDAMSLVPEGWLSFFIGQTDDGKCYAALAGNDGHMTAEDPDENYVETTAATLSNALAAAALRARASEQKG